VVLLADHDRLLRAAAFSYLDQIADRGRVLLRQETWPASTSKDSRSG
jgi:hypothetical protein